MENSEIIEPAQTRPQETSQASAFWLPELDGLRSLAFILVYYHHTVGLFWRDNPGNSALYKFLFYTDQRIHNWGWVGVDLFFVLSAFLITSLLLREKERNSEGTVSLKKFFARRILRIWPLYFCYLVLVAALSMTLDPAYTGAALIGPQASTAGWIQLAAYTFFAGNFAAVFQGVILHLLNPMWSLCIEEQFYIIWGMSLRYLRKDALLLGVLGAGAVAAPGLRFILWSRDPQNYLAYYLNSLSHCDAIVYGGILAFVWRRWGEKFKTSAMLQSLAAAAAFLLLLPLAWVPYIEQSDASIIWVMSSVAAGFTALVLTALSNSAVKKFFSLPLLTHIGKLTYGLYIFHFFVIYSLYYFCHTQLHITSQVTYLLITWPLGLTLTYLLARLSWRFIESPALALKEKYRSS